MLTNLYLPLDVKKKNARLTHIDKDHLIIYDDGKLIAYDTTTLTEVLFSLAVDDRYQSFYRKKSAILMNSNEGTIRLLDIENKTIKEINADVISPYIFIETLNSEVSYFFGEQKISKINVDNFDVIKSTAPLRRAFIPVSLNSGFCLKSKNIFKFYNKDLELVYELDIPKLLEQSEITVKLPYYSYKDSVLIQTSNNSLISCVYGSQKINWKVENCLHNNWVLGNEDKVYSVFKGNLKIIDAETGKLILDKAINNDWIQAKKERLNLFQINVSSTHLWCGFLGHGLCAINLETAEVDWHHFDGQSLNCTPIITDNRIYVELMNGGLGLDNTGTQEYILEGDGGYIPDSNEKFLSF